MVARLTALLLYLFLSLAILLLFFSVFFFLFSSFFFFSELGTSRTLHLLGKRSTTEFNPQPVSLAILVQTGKVSEGWGTLGTRPGAWWSLCA